MSSPLAGAQPGRATEVRCRHCQDRVLVTTADRVDAIKHFVAHQEKVHPEVGHVLIEGMDVLLTPAPYRCDLCCVVVAPPSWTYVTDKSAPDGFFVEDPKWLVCDACHDIITSYEKPLKQLLARVVAVQYETFILEGVPRADIVAQLKDGMRGFLDHRTDEPPYRWSGPS